MSGRNPTPGRPALAELLKLGMRLIVAGNQTSRVADLLRDLSHRDPGRPGCGEAGRVIRLSLATRPRAG
ncbi:hypothetical protein [Streptomyces himalayensis]|uniref:Uncharacterized protein n=1 Tax=Streptomyces himalayensis subsp. himalayensis TaxID=2756131 RepID=A0A7W0DLH3_9ACTN|nr:hypothetical protein [Streptomyces himalayensis]MBA2946813.1 hypothetical protein [Streptomyces himalayensis subsp. himalayensis]